MVLAARMINGFRSSYLRLEKGCIAQHNPYWLHYLDPNAMPRYMAM